MTIEDSLSKLNEEWPMKDRIKPSFDAYNLGIIGQRSGGDANMVLKCVEQVVDTDALNPKERNLYRGLCLDLQLLQRRSGLAGTLRWLAYKGDWMGKNGADTGGTVGAGWLAAQLSWLLWPFMNAVSPDPVTKPGGPAIVIDTKEAIQKLVQETLGHLEKADMDTRLALNRRVLELSEWFKLYAETLIPELPEEPNTPDRNADDEPQDDDA